MIHWYHYFIFFPQVLEWMPRGRVKFRKQNDLQLMQLLHAVPAFQQRGRFASLGCSQETWFTEERQMSNTTAPCTYL